MTEDEARQKDCCVMDKKCTASDCLGWRWYHWRAGQNAPLDATAGTQHRLALHGQELGYCGRAGEGEYS